MTKILAFEKYDYLKIKDLERCPYVIFSSEAEKWMIKDNYRMLLIALDRYADRLQYYFKSGDRVRMKYGNEPYSSYPNYEYGQVTIVSNLGIKVMFDNEYLDYWYYNKHDLQLVEK